MKPSTLPVHLFFVHEVSEFWETRILCREDLSLANRQVVLRRFLLDVAFQVHLLSRLELSDFVLEVLDGDVAEVQVRTQHGHVCIQVDGV